MSQASSKSMRKSKVRVGASDPSLSGSSVYQFFFHLLFCSSIYEMLMKWEKINWWNHRTANFLCNCEIHNLHEEIVKWQFSLIKSDAKILPLFLNLFSKTRNEKHPEPQNSEERNWVKMRRFLIMWRSFSEIRRLKSSFSFELMSDFQEDHLHTDI